MKMAREDLQRVRQLVAERHGKELTPDQLEQLFKECKDLEIVDEPGLVTEIRRQERGDSGSG